MALLIDRWGESTWMVTSSTIGSKKPNNGPHGSLTISLNFCLTQGLGGYKDPIMSNNDVGIILTHKPSFLLEMRHQKSLHILTRELPFQWLVRNLYKISTLISTSWVLCVQWSVRDLYKTSKLISTSWSLRVQPCNKLLSLVYSTSSRTWTYLPSMPNEWSSCPRMSM